MTEPTNKDRGERARPLIEQYQAAHDKGEDFETAARDLISDILHAITEAKFDAIVSLRLAEDNYDAEIRQEECLCTDWARSAGHDADCPQAVAS